MGVLVEVILVVVGHRLGCQIVAIGFPALVDFHWDYRMNWMKMMLMIPEAVFVDFDHLGYWKEMEEMSQMVVVAAFHLSALRVRKTNW